MSDENNCIPFELAQKLVGAVMEEEHLEELGRRILTVYDKNDQEVCWFDAEEIMREMAESEGGIPKNQDDMKAKAVEMVMHQIPEWAVDDLLKKMEEK